MAILVAGCLHAAQLKPPTVDAFNRYIRELEQRLNHRKSFLWADESPTRAQRVLLGEIVVGPGQAKPISPVPDGLVHDWVGTVFLPGTNLETTLAVIRNYDRHKEIYKPEVIDSKILARTGNEFRVYMRLLKKQVITVVLDTEHDARWVPVDATRWRSASYSTRIAEVSNAGKPEERVLPPGTGQGFLWKIDSYWRLEERDGGTWVECEAVSLTRDIPTGLGWLIQPIIQSLPKTALENTLRETRAAFK